ncbi:hypothetical protein GQ53DRAFT_315182 [Thozetella sp. PMI_491]|nr:hypothetical protein GQ53DRAFT_315182 [Thozetella sp. PMI_491]
MARLNMPPVPMENMSLERLRRKFAEQNSVLVKSNTRQAGQIQKLNNECARLLSENLDLRGQVLRLEKEVQDNRARRVADHALEVKAKLEEQLLELSSTLAGLGLEPPRKRYSSPTRRKIAQPRKSPAATSPPRRRGRDLPMDSEALAFREGRLPPILEAKSYPRATLSAEEIMALCGDVVDTTDSPELGPPPVSRYVEEVLQTDSPSKKATDKAETTADNSQDMPSSKLDRQQMPTKETPAKKQELAAAPATIEARSDKENISLSSTAPTARGGKRKFGDEIEATKPTKPLLGKERKETSRNEPPTKPVSSREIPKQRSIKDLPAGRREKASLAQGAARKPLSVKSSNEDLLSPRKASKPVTLDEVTTAKARVLKESLSKEHLHLTKPIPRIEIPEPELSAVVSVLHDPTTPCVDAVMASPDTPDRSARRDGARDTPPPADISSKGEISRPSRRARSAISYAEPNLRDKMRRPTKELFDAVAGEGKFVHRPPKSDEPGVASATKPEPSRSSESEAAVNEAAQRATIGSPLAGKAAAQEALMTTIMTDRRKRPSTSGRELLIPSELAELAKRAPGDEQPKSASMVAKEPAVKADRFPDVYDFSSSSPAAEPRERPEDGEMKARPSSRNARRSSTALSKYTTVETVQATAKAKSSSSRKRASMVAPEKTPMLDSSDLDLSIVEQQGSVDTSTRDRISRRRSMML